MGARGPEVRLYTVQEIADQLGFSEKSILRWIAAGILKAHKFGAAVRISAEDLRTFLALHRQG
jgi:excisionase family DNA binding protein